MSSNHDCFLHSWNETSVLKRIEYIFSYEFGTMPYDRIDSNIDSCILNGVAVTQSVELATPCEEVPGSIPAVAARSLLVESVSV